MFNLATKKDLEKIEKKIRNAFEKSKKELQELRTEFQNLVREKVREPTPRTSTEKQIKRVVNNQKLMKAIHSCIKEGYSTNRIKEDIMSRFKIGKTKFFDCLKLVREKVREPTPRTSIIELNKGRKV